MSLIFTPRSQRVRGRDLWPLLVFAIGLVVVCAWLWANWSLVLLQSAACQRELNQLVSQLLRGIASTPVKSGIMLVGVSFLYGVLHALGPGHGKVIIATWLATNPAKLKTSLRMTLAASLLQGLVAVMLVFVVLYLLGLPSRQLHYSHYLLEKASFIVVTLLGVMLCLRAVRQLWRTLKHPLRFKRLYPAGSTTPAHIHSAHCGCGHQHMPLPEQVSGATTWREKALVIGSMGMRPCSGAIMVLLFSKVAGVFSWGIVAAMAMAAGTALTISFLAFLTHGCRALAQRLVRERGVVYWQQTAWATLALAGGVVLCVCGIVLWQSTELVLPGLRGRG